MSVARFEVMRAATDRRNTVWAAALATQAREPSDDVRRKVSEAILSLLRDGDVALAVTSWSGGQPHDVESELAETALLDESQWHPRRLPWAKRLRLFASQRGEQKFLNGEYGRPQPIATKMPAASSAYELQSLSCSEALGMAASVAAFVAGSALGFVVGNGGVATSIDDWSASGVVGWLVGGAVGLALGTSAWNRAFPSESPENLPADVIPDQFNSGPDLNAADRFGDPRY